MTGSREKRWRRRLQYDVRLASLILFGLIAVLFLGPFAIYRLTIGDWLAGLLEIVMIILILGCVVSAWRSTDARIQGTIIAVIISLSAAILITWLGNEAVYWIYVCLVVNLILSTRSIGLACNLLVIGVLALQPDTFPDRVHLGAFVATTLLVTIYSFIFATQVERYQTLLKVQTERDPLTQLGNRRMLESSLKMAVGSAHDQGLRHSLAVIDLDHFKRVNDRYGHATGDKVLKDVAELLKSTTRSQDQLFRMGGEEFVVLMTNTSLEGAETAAEKLRQQAEEKLRVEDGPITISAGLAEISPSDQNWESWLERADRALYQAKRDGRNRVCSAP